MRFALSFLALLLVALLSISVTEAVARPSHLMTSNGNHYDPKLDQTCFAYTLTCNEDYCPPVTGFDLDCNCPVVAASPDLSAGDNSISWNNGTAHGSGNGTARGELLQVEFCVGGRVAGKKHARFTITTIIVIIIGEIIVPDCHPYPTVCPTECPTECPTVCPTPTEEPTQPQGNDVCEFIITPASLQVNSSTQFDVSLATQPDGPVSVTLSASCVLLSDCLITFDADTWNIPQTIEVYRNPAYQLGNNCTIELVATGAQECNASIPVTILPQPLTPAQTWADPHVMTFDGFYFRAFSTGDFYFVRQFNGNLVIQTRQTACGPASCNTAVAIRFGTLEFYLVLPPTGDAQITIIGDAATNGVTITNTDPVRVYLPGGGFISIKVINEGGNHFLNIEANLPDTYRGQVGGLAGNFDGNPNNELTILQTGAPAANLDAFIASNLVPNSENLFSNSEAVIPPIRGASPPEPVEVGETCTPYSPPNDATPFLQANAANQSPLSGLPLIQSEDSVANCAAAPEAVKQKAISVCSKFFAPDLVGCCTPFGVLSDTYYQSCLCDYALIQNAEFVFAHLLAYASSCETAANSKQKSCAAFASEIEAPQSENQTPCDSNPCLNGGACTNAGTNYQCDCTGTGFKGARCAQRITCAPVALEDHAVWGQSFAGQIAWGKCEAGFVGQPYRSCLESGQFGPITNPCISATTQCAAESYHNAEWSPTNVNTFGSGLCLPGFGGSPTRLCKANAIWSTNVLNFCKRLYCTPENAGGASWKSTASLTTVTARCDVGTGSVQRTCQADGTWSAVQGTCASLSSVPCVSETYVRAVWPETQPGETATGRCISGWGGAPKRVCNRDGTWQDLVRDHCQRV